MTEMTLPRNEVEAPRPFGDDLQTVGVIRILVIDDDAATCQVIEAALAAKDFVIDTVSEPQRVEVAVRTRDDDHPPYHLIILDYVLPSLNTEQVMGWIRDDQPDAAVIVITGFPSMEGAVNCLRARTFDYLVKPFQIAALRESVYRCLQGLGLLRMSETALQLALGKALRDRRKTLSFTLSDVAKRTSLSLGYLSQIELGKSSASVETLYRICLALGLKMSELFDSVQKGP